MGSAFGNEVFIITSDSFIEIWNSINAKIRQKWEALRRNDNYIKDRDNAFTVYMERLITEGKRPEGDLIAEVLFRSSPEGIELARKYNLTAPFNPNDQIIKYHKNAKYVGGFKIFLDDHAVNASQIAAIRSLVEGDTPNCREDSPYIRNDRYLVLAVDLQKPKKQIMNEIGHYLERYHPGMRKVRGPAIEFYLDTPNGDITIYEIWDMHYKDDKSPWEICQELFPWVKGKSYQPHAKNYSNETKAILKRIKDAIKRADNLISSFNPTT